MADMKVLAIVSQKGGPGKTTLAVHLSVAAEAAGLTTALIDLDPQASAAKWSDKREGDTPVVISAHSTRLPQVLQSAEANGLDLCILDTAPTIEKPAKDACKAADLVIIPCKPAIFDLEAMGLTVHITQSVNVPTRVVFNGVPARSSMLIKAKKALEIYDIQAAPCIIGDRVAFSYSVIDGRTAQEYEPSGKASREIQVLYNYIAKEMGVV